MLKKLYGVAVKKINCGLNSFARINTRIEKTLHIDESYTAHALQRLCFMPDIAHGLDAKKISRFLIPLLYLTMSLFTVIPGFVLFLLVAAIYLLFVAEHTRSYKKCTVTAFDVLLAMFCLAILTAASFGKGFLDVATIFLSYGSFMMLYFVIVNTALTDEILFKLKLIFCMVGAAMALIQLAENILSYEMKVLGQIYVLSASMAFELFFITKNKRLKLLLMASAAVMLIALTVCWSGGSWVWATFILAFFIVIKDWRFLLVGGVGLLFVPFILPGEIIDFHTLKGTGIINYLFAPSAEYRISAYEALKGIFNYYTDYQSWGKAYASMIIVACIAVLLVLLLREIFFGFKTGQTGMVLAVLSAVGFGVTGFLYSDITIGVWEHYRTLFVFWIYTSVYAAEARKNKACPENEIQHERARFCFIDVLPFFMLAAYVIAAV